MNVLRFRPRSPLPALLLLLAAASGAQARAQMLPPALDRPDEPFSYFSRPTDVLGVMDGRRAFLVTPEGFLYTGYAELMFFTGNPPVPVEQRVKTLWRDVLPVVEYTVAQEGLAYHVRAFATTLDGDPESPLMGFVRVVVENPGAEPRAAYFGAAARYQNEVNTSWGRGDNRFRRPVTAQRLGGYDQEGEAFDSSWVYEFREDAFLRDGRVLFLFPRDPEPERHLTLKEGNNGPPSLSPRSLNILPTTPVGLVLYRSELAPGAADTLEFRLPYRPLEAADPLVDRLREASFDAYLERTAAFWDEILAEGLEILVDEPKVVHTFRTNLIYDLIARDKVGDAYIQTVNPFHYHAFWLRDASYIVRMYDVTGYHRVAREVLDFFARWQGEDGNFVSQGGQFDGWGQTLWAYGQHFRITRDTAFAAGVYPAVRRAVDWLRQARAGDPLHLMPVTTPGDNEDITGHVTGHNFWALGGLKNAIALARALGEEEDARLWEREYEDFHRALRQRLREVTAGTGGYIPPGLDSLGGQDWGNMLSVYPEKVLEPLDPLVTATLEATRAKYQEGIMTYGDGRWLHHYLTMKNTETAVIRGEQEQVLREFYAILLHTSSTHAGFEYSILPWGTRDFGMNLTPHGWFAAKFRTLLRNMMVREEGSSLHLLSAVSPAWAEPGDTLQVRRAPTEFGRVAFTARFREDGVDLELDNAFRSPPDSLVVHLPWFVRAEGAVADGEQAPVRPPPAGVQGAGARVVLPPGARRLSVSWERVPGVPAMSYEEAVRAYKAEYARRYRSFLRGGGPGAFGERPRFPASSPGTFEERPRFPAGVPTPSSHHPPTESPA